MKKITILSLLIFGAALASQAQIEQGAIYAGASSNINYSSTSIDGVDDNLSQFNIGLSGGYFFAENLMGGLLLDYQSIKQGDSDGSSTTIGLFGRYYINGQIFVGAGYASTSIKDVDVSFGQLPLEVGYATFLTDNMSIEPSLRYSLATGDNEANVFSLNVGFGIYLNR